VPSPFLDVNLSGQAGVGVVDAAWNCGADFPSLLAVCLSDGALQLLDITDHLKIVGSLPAGKAQATCSEC
jgi:hypothetical protein